jgi:sulfite reductase beta subunit-like hemoprotein
MRNNGVEDSRLTIRQNIVLRNVQPDRLPQVWRALHDIGMDRDLAEKSGDVVSCPGAETCNLAITASRGLGEAVTDKLLDEDLAGVAGVSINISGCPNSCGQHQAFDIGFSGMARRDEDGNEGPGYRVFVGAHIEDGGAKFGDYVAKVPALHAPEAASRLIRTYLDERTNTDDPFWAWAERTGRAGLKTLLGDLDVKKTKAEAPEYFQDFGQSQAFEVILGRSECA